MNINNKKYTREDILRRNNPSALYGARRIVIADGRARGHRMIEVKTSGGLRAMISEDRCLDIIDLEYKGVNLAFLSKNGIVNSSIANPENNSFAKYWQGGFLATCGLRNTGGACEVDDELFPIHGHIGQTQAEATNIYVDESVIAIIGIIRETSLFGHNLEMVRTITIPSDGAKITVKDVIHNLAPEDEAVFLLYHINFGFPFLNEDLELQFPKGAVRGRTEYAQSVITEHTKITAPIDGAQEVVFFHTPDEGKSDVQVQLVNKLLGVRAAISYDRERLPVLAQWKCMRSGDYALGIEPGTSFIRGRKDELAHGYDIKIPGFGELSFGFTLEVDSLWKN